MTQNLMEQEVVGKEAVEETSKHKEFKDVIDITGIV